MHVFFTTVYFTSTLSEGFAVGPGIKVASTVVTIWTMALLVRGWRDFVAGALGMCLAIGALAAIGIDVDRTDLSAGIDAIENANRNAYSLYALPCILLGGFILTARANVSIVVRSIIIASIGAASLCICLNINRSGWLGLFAIVLVLVYEKSIKATIIVGVLGSVLAGVLMFAFDLSHIENRVQQTTKGNPSDELRWKIFAVSAEIATEHPLLGVSPEYLPSDIAAKLGYRGDYVETHNVIAHLAAGSGLVSLSLVCYIGALLWRMKPLGRGTPAALNRFFESRRLLRYLLALWVVRGMFSHEIIYSPSFAMAIGLCLGLCIVHCPKPNAPRAYRPGYRSLSHEHAHYAMLEV